MKTARSSCIGRRFDRFRSVAALYIPQRGRRRAPRAGTRGRLAVRGGRVGAATYEIHFYKNKARME